MNSRMSEQQTMDMLLIMANMTASLSSISKSMEQIVEKLDNIDSSLIHQNSMFEGEVNGN